MDYIVQILSAILIGVSVAAIFGTRTMFVIVGAIAAIALAIVTMVSLQWWVLWAGVACFIVGQLLHRDTFQSAAG